VEGKTETILQCSQSTYKFSFFWLAVMLRGKVGSPAKIYEEITSIT
jgi:hypothetical protein